MLFRSTYSNLVVSGGVLYGMTRLGGTNGFGVVFSMDTGGATYMILHEFGSAAGDGHYPYGDLLLVGGTLYGMTYTGTSGISNYGTVFSIGTGGAAYSILHTFGNNPDGSYPYGSLVYDSGSGMLYGTTRSGGVNYGTLFEMSLDGMIYNIRYNFQYDANGYNPYSSLIFDGGWLYGTTYTDLGNYDGVVFKVLWDGTSYTVLHNFNDQITEATYPKGNLVQDGNVLYGITTNGGIYNSGTLYKVNPDGTGYSILHHFNLADVNDGDNPYAEVVQVGNTLYGTTYDGGAFGLGTIYKINTDGTGFTLLYSFQGGAADGDTPYAPLIWDGSLLYGTALAGDGINNNGTIFSIDTAGITYSIMHLFDNVPDGRNPYGGLLDDGTYLYGMTSVGGINNWGTIFKISKSTYTLTILHNFTGGSADGSYPYGSLVTDGTYLYGMASGGGVTGEGTVFRMLKDGTGFVLMHSFSYSVDGAYPDNSLILDGTKLYGVTPEGSNNLSLD